MIKLFISSTANYFLLSFLFYLSLNLSLYHIFCISLSFFHTHSFILSFPFFFFLLLFLFFSFSFSFSHFLTLFFLSLSFPFLLECTTYVSKENSKRIRMLDRCSSLNKMIGNGEKVFFYLLINIDIANNLWD